MRCAILAILSFVMLCGETPDSRVFLAGRFGGSGFDEANAVARDAQGNLYMRGRRRHPTFR